MGLHVDEVFGRPDEPDTVVCLYALINHVQHGDGTTEVLHVASAIGYGMDVLVVLVQEDKRVEGLVAEARAAVCVEPN